MFDGNWESVFGTEDNDTFKLKTIANEEDSIIVSWSLKREMHDLKVLEERWKKSCDLISRGSSAVEASFKHGTRQFLKTKSGQKAEYEPNTSLYEKRRKYAGFYALKTSLKALSSAEVYSKLRQLWRVEECFRVLKSNLEARPVYVWSTEHIKGHFLVCYLALVLERLSLKMIREAGIEVSANKLIDLMRMQSVAELPSLRKSVKGYLRIGHQGIQDEIELSDRIMTCFNLEAVNELEADAGLRKKLKVRLPIR